MMERITELETPVGVLRVTDGESTIPFDVRPNRFLDRPWKVRDDADIMVDTIDTDAKYSIYVPLADLEIGREYTISFSAGEWREICPVDFGYCNYAVIDGWVAGIGAADPDEDRSLFYTVDPLEENNGFRFRLIDKGRANAHFDVAWVKIGPYTQEDYVMAVYSWLHKRVWLADRENHPGDFCLELEEQMWKAAQNRDAASFMELVSEDAVMVRGGYRCTGREYAEIIRDFDCKDYQIDRFEAVCVTEDIVQTHYIVSVEAEREERRDFAGRFHVTTTWRKKNGRWMAVFNMESVK